MKHHPHRAPALIVLAATAACAVAGCLSLKHNPPEQQVRDGPALHPAPAYDVWGRYVSQPEADQMLKTPQGRQTLSPASGAVKVDRALLDQGRTAYYEETFGKEFFLTEVLGMLNGPLKPESMAAAIWRSTTAAPPTSASPWPRTPPSAALTSRRASSSTRASTSPAARRK